MNNHNIIDTNQLKKGRFTFSGLSEKTKNQLIAGGLSFAGIMAAIGLNKLFMSDAPIEIAPLSGSTEPIIDEGLTANENTPPDDGFGEESYEAMIPTEENLVEEPAADLYTTEAIEEDVAEYTVTFDSDATFAYNVQDDMDFDTAFSNARAEVGMGGFFNWNDNSYSTYTREEWDAMSWDDKQRFFADVSDQTQLDVDEWTIEQDNNEQFDDSTADIEEIDASDLEIFEEDSSNTDAPDMSADVETITIVPPAAYGMADMNSDGVVDAIVIDNNNDGQADLLALDEDFDGTYETFMINEDGDEDLDVFIIDEGGDGIDDSDSIEEISDIVDMEDFIVLEEDDDVLDDLDFIDELIDIDGSEDGGDDDVAIDTGFDDPGL